MDLPSDDFKKQTNKSRATMAKSLRSKKTKQLKMTNKAFSIRSKQLQQERIEKERLEDQERYKMLFGMADFEFKKRKQSTSSIQSVNQSTINEITLGSKPSKLA